MGKQVIKVHVPDRRDEDGTLTSPAHDEYHPALSGYFIKGISYLCGFSAIALLVGLLLGTALYGALYKKYASVDDFFNLLDDDIFLIVIGGVASAIAMGGVSALSSIYRCLMINDSEVVNAETKVAVERKDLESCCGIMKIGYT